MRGVSTSGGEYIGGSEYIRGGEYIRGVSTSEG